MRIQYRRIRAEKDRIYRRPPHGRITVVAKRIVVFENVYHVGLN
jgi:hypothetical protein